MRRKLELKKFKKREFTPKAKTKGKNAIQNFKVVSKSSSQVASKQPGVLEWEGR